MIKKLSPKGPIAVYFTFWNQFMPPLRIIMDWGRKNVYNFETCKANMQIRIPASLFVILHQQPHVCI